MKWYCLSLNKTCCIIHFMYFLWVLRSNDAARPAHFFIVRAHTHTISSATNSIDSTIPLFLHPKTYQEQAYLMKKKKRIASEEEHDALSLRCLFTSLLVAFIEFSWLHISHNPLSVYVCDWIASDFLTSLFKWLNYVQSSFYLLNNIF